MIVSGLRGDNWISDGRDWTKPNEDACVGFLTYAGIQMNQAVKLKTINISGENLPNFDLQASDKDGSWTSIAEVSLKASVNNFKLEVPDELDSFPSFRVTINSREPWLVNCLDFEVE